MSSIRLSCPSCSGLLTLRPDLAGKRIKCPKCQAVVEVPRGTGPSGPAAGGPASGGAAASRPRSSRKPKPAGAGDQIKQARVEPPIKKTRRSRPPASSKPASPKPRRQRSRQPVDDGFDAFDDSYDDGYDEFGEFDDLSSTKRNASAKKSGGWARAAILVFAIALAIRTAGFMCQLIVEFNDGGSRFGPSQSMATLLKTNQWLHFAALVIMVVAYVLFVVAPDRNGSQGWGIACLVMGLIALGVLFYREILPLIDSNRRDPFLRGRELLQTSLGGSLIKKSVLEITIILHMALGLMFISSFSRSKNSKVSDQCRPAIAFLGVHGALLVFANLFVLFVAKVVLPAALESREPPSEIWRWISEGGQWLAVATFLVFLILGMRASFGAQSVLK